MPSRVYNCLTCGASLPVDKPATQKSVACTYCAQANANPNFIENSVPVQTSAPTNQTEVKTTNSDVPVHAISIMQSNFAIIYSVLTTIAGITLYIYYQYNLQSIWIYFATSVLMLLPSIAESFTKQRWTKVAIRETVKSQEKYIVTYVHQDEGFFEIANILGSYIFLIWFTYSFFMGIIPVFDEADGNMLTSGLLAFFLSMAGVWILYKIIEDLGKSLGKIFSK